MIICVRTPAFSWWWCIVGVGRRCGAGVALRSELFFLFARFVFWCELVVGECGGVVCVEDVAAVLPVGGLFGGESLAEGGGLAGLRFVLCQRVLVRIWERGDVRCKKPCSFARRPRGRVEASYPFYDNTTTSSVRTLQC